MVSCLCMPSTLITSAANVGVLLSLSVSLPLLERLELVFRARMPI